MEGAEYPSFSSDDNHLEERKERNHVRCKEHKQVHGHASRGQRRILKGIYTAISCHLSTALFLTGLIPFLYDLEASLKIFTSCWQ